MEIEELQEMVQENLRANSRIPKTVCLSITNLLYIAYQIGKGEDVEIINAQTEDEMIAKFLETSEVKVIRSGFESDDSQTSHQIKL